jgi:hypothetical protein
MLLHQLGPCSKTCPEASHSLFSRPLISHKSRQQPISYSISASYVLCWVRGLLILQQDLQPVQLARLQQQQTAAVWWWQQQVLAVQV